MKYEVLIVGKGLIGSAVARHLSYSVGNLAIVGPDEPQDYNLSVVYASHYDSGRVQRLIGQTDAMTQLNLASVRQYATLQKESGILFHKGAGCLYVNPLGNDAYLDQVNERAGHFGLEATMYDAGKKLADSFREFHFPASAKGMYEPAPSGYISPPQLIKAQLHVFEKNEGVILRETVNGIFYRKGFAEVTTVEGNSYRAAKVVLAAGAFTNFSNLLEQPLDVVIKSETVLLAKVSREEARRLSSMPSLLYELDNGEVEGVYATPPIQYPDGNYYLKMGCNLPEDIFFGSDLREIQNWFRHGDSKASEAKMMKHLKEIMPHLQVEGGTTKRCILPRTQHHKNPYIGKIHERLFLTAPNGWSAMCADGIGKVMASLVTHGVFPAEYAAADFQPFFR